MERSTVALILLYISAVSVSSGQPVLLDSAEGETVTFHTAVRNMQILLYNGDVIGDVTDGKVKPTRIERFKGRVHWNSSTEFFSITDLKMDDSGKYKAQSDDGRAVSEFQLTVHTPVSKPDVLQEEDHCTLRCSVERGTGVTLSWRRVDGQVLNRPSPKNAPVSQLVTVTEGTYICEAKNPVSTERDSITMGKDCKSEFFTLH
ncbi:hypothetical protein MATL_G00220830 [Megalops atlanticus]|uniref:Ig-like domain-containing protein n=1 Tax=Megalops atlanticus TaxID=7932 RepID=A0A9D3PEF1_MEGAT|nr:hypothetical protein MATL_G00220830 [Megalops atlanticus]